jgi:hypothetical protein
MEKEFIPYEQALALKELGFDEEVIATYPKDSKDLKLNNVKTTVTIKAILYQQAFRWFREKYNFHYEIVLNKDRDLPYTYVVDTLKLYLRSPFHKTYEQAELECLKKLIEIIKNKKKL